MTAPAGGDGVRGASGAEVPGLIPSASADALRERLSPQERRRRRQRRQKKRQNPEPEAERADEVEGGEGEDDAEPPHQIDLLA